MNVFRLIAREIAFRKLNFALAAASVAAAAGCLVAQLTLLRSHDLHTAKIIAAKEEEAKTLLADFDAKTEALVAAKEEEARTRLEDFDRKTEEVIAAKEDETRQRTAALQDDYRKIMKKLGFNLLILPKDQNLGDLFADDYAAKTMPEDYVHKLADSRIMTVRHLLPILQQKSKWPEARRTVILIGTRGEVPLIHRKPKEPMMTLVQRDSIVLGHELHHGLGLKVGDTTKLLGHDFTVAKCHKERGTKDDITIWLNLKQAQELLDKEGQINGILALQCVCSAGMIAQIRKEVATILPDTQVIEFQSKILIRYEARMRAAEEAKQALAQEKANRARLRKGRQEFAAKSIADEKANRTRLRDQRKSYAVKAVAAERDSRDRLKRQREGFAAILVPLVCIAAVVWVGYMVFSNVRERLPEIGILRAIGFRRSQVFAIFLGKAVLVGVLGATLGCAGGFAIGVAAGAGAPAAALFDPTLLAAVLVLAPLLSALASWLPAMLAAQQDPAVVLTNA